jgi:hypothetical protein
MQVIGTVSILGTNNIRALGEGALEKAYSGNQSLIQMIKTPDADKVESY